MVAEGPLPFRPPSLPLGWLRLPIVYAVSLLACARLSDSIVRTYIYIKTSKAKIRRARLGRATFHHYLGAWNRLSHSFFAIFFSTAEPQYHAM